MSRKNFLATDFFITASEKEARVRLATLPEKIANARLVKENALAHNTRFAYEDNEKGTACFVDVSLLPLNEQFVRVNLHASHTNGHAFHNDPALTAVLQLFEQVMVKGRVEEVQAKPSRKIGAKKESAVLAAVLSFFLSKYHY